MGLGPQRSEGWLGEGYFVSRWNGAGLPPPPENSPRPDIAGLPHPVFRIAHKEGRERLAAAEDLLWRRVTDPNPVPADFIAHETA